MKRISSLVISLAVLLLMLSCQSLPEPVDRNETLLIIDAHFEYKGTSRKPFRYYILHLDGSEEIIKIKPSTNLIIINYLEPGNYTISKVESIHMEANRPRTEDVNISFTLEQGQITILDHRFSMWIQPEKKDGSNYYQYWLLERMDRSELDEIRRDIREMNNFEMWDGFNYLDFKRRQ